MKFPSQPLQLEYGKVFFQEEEMYRGPTMSYELWSHFCRDRGINESLISFAHSPAVSAQKEPIEVPGVPKYACGSWYKGETEKLKKGGSGYLMLCVGDSYKGDFKNGHRHGYGITTRSGGKGGYKGDWQFDYKHGCGEENWGESARFEGIWEHGKQKFGVLEWVSKQDKTNRYEGGFDGALFDGYGVLISDNAMFEGFWKESVLNGEGSEKSLTAEKKHYVGGWKNGQYFGDGELTDNSGHYKGKFIGGLFDGYGEKQYADGDSYVGTWRQGLYYAQGILKAKNGEEYKGEFANGCKEGYGEMRYASGNTYVGTWKNDLRNGKGEMRWGNKDSYVGDFKDDKYEGQGKLQQKSDPIEAAGIKSVMTIYEGRFVNGLADGAGTLTKVFVEMINYLSVKKTEIYQGEFLKGEYNGTGTYIYNDGSKYQGQWKNGLREGNGVLFGGSGEILAKGAFVHGNPVIRKDDY